MRAGSARLARRANGAAAWLEFDDEWQGVISIEVQLAVRARSGRPKHTDPQEQGRWLVQALEDRIKELEQAADVRTGSVKMVGHRDEKWTDWSQAILMAEEQPTS